MDGPSFDQWAKMLVTRSDRRRVLQGGSGLVAALLGTMTLETTAEARRHRVKQQARGTKGPDPCAVRCANEPKARGAQCRQTCKTCAAGPKGTCYHSDTGAFTCEDIANDPSNCGNCGQTCPASTPSCADEACCVAKGESCSGSPVRPCCGAENACVAGTCDTCLPENSPCFLAGGCCAGFDCQHVGPGSSDYFCVPQT